MNWDQKMEPDDIPEIYLCDYCGKEDGPDDFYEDYVCMNCANQLGLNVNDNNEVTKND